MTDNPKMIFLIEKRGLYYRPDAAGYTGLKRDAGRYSFADAAVHCGPNGPDGSQDGLVVWEEDEAPEYSSRCPWDVKMEDQAYRSGYVDGRADLSDAKDKRIAELEEQNASLNAAIKRQAGAARTLRELTLAEVQHLSDMDRSEYFAAQTVDSERAANAILTDRVEELEAKLEGMYRATTELRARAEASEAKLKGTYQ